MKADKQTRARTWRWQSSWLLVFLAAGCRHAEHAVSAFGNDHSFAPPVHAAGGQIARLDSASGSLPVTRARRSIGGYEEYSRKGGRRRPWTLEPAVGRFHPREPAASAKEVYQFGGRLMDEFGLSGLRIGPY